MATVRPNGGRGKRAPYQTTHIRVPLPLKAYLESLVAQYKENELLQLGNQPMTSENAAELARKILEREKSAKAAMNQLLSEIYRVSFSL